jgi:hypothetical protein
MNRRSPPRAWLAAALGLVCFFPLNAELLFSPEIKSSPGRLERLNEAVAVLREYAPESPVLRWARDSSDPAYAGDLCLRIQELDESTAGQWNGAEIVLGVETMDKVSVHELALILYHEAAHADHHYRDLESLLINEYSFFFSPRQYLLFEMINEALAVYKETALRYRIGVNREAEHKYAKRPTLARYNEDFYAWYKDLRRWMKSRPGYARLAAAEFEEALFRECITGFLHDPWYLDYYMPQFEQRFTILRGKDFAVCPMPCSGEFARFTGKNEIAAVLNRYIEKNSPDGMKLGLNAGELEAQLEKALDSFENDDDDGEGPHEKAALKNAGVYRKSQKNYEQLPERFAALPPGIELRYSYSFGSESVKAFHRMLDELGSSKSAGVKVTER